MLDAFAIENYRMQALSLGQVAELLDMSIDETHAFLKKHRVPGDYTRDDLERDEQAVELFSHTTPLHYAWCVSCVSWLSFKT